MISHILQNLTNVNHYVQPHACPAQCMPQMSGEGLIKRSFHELKTKIKSAWDHQIREAEYHDAARHLHKLTDEQLRDMGITRMDIHHVVRYGKD